ncbi:MAG TPA: hypothetical protein VHK70_03465 [Burkholderiaceae bacterium]|jgi:hypothetical protein|nr:hypothetical protein [Burkholderiaceae bacterium]
MWVLATTGAMGEAALVFLLWATFRSYRRLSGEYRHYLVAIWLGFGAICQFEPYLWRSNTALMFCALMAIVLASPASARYGKVIS